MRYPCHLISRPLSWWTWDLRVPALFIFQSISILLHDNTPLISPQCLYAYLFSIPTQRPIVCAPVPCSHPSLLHPHADSHPSYRCLQDHVPIDYCACDPVVLFSISSSPILL